MMGYFMSITPNALIGTQSKMFNLLFNVVVFESFGEG